MLNYFTHKHPLPKPWIVFIHGAGGSASAWQRQWDYFKDHYNLLAMDLRDHGQSKNIVPEYETYNFKLIAHDILEVIEAECIEKAHFITLSFGSVLLQDLSMRRPDLVQSAIMAGGIFKGSMPVKVFVHLARFFNLFLTYPQMYNTFSWLLMPRESHQISRRVYRTFARRISNNEYLKWLGLYSTFFKTLKRFFDQQVSFPSLVVMGTDDYIFLRPAKEFVANQQKVKLKIIEQAGHICNIDNAPIFNSISDVFLRTLKQKEEPMISI